MAAPLAERSSARHFSILFSMKNFEGNLLFFDCETTGLFEYGTELLPETAFLFPRIVQLAWSLRNEHGEVIASACNIVRPEGFTIPNRVAEIHGITTQRALAEGEPLHVVLDSFVFALGAADFLVAHNFDFDFPVVGAEFLRSFRALPAKPAYCTQKQSTSWAQIPAAGRRGYDRYKWPSLAELHALCGFGEIANAHDASADIAATARCFFHLLNVAPETFSQPYFLP